MGQMFLGNSTVEASRGSYFNVQQLGMPVIRREKKIALRLTPF